MGIEVFRVIWRQVLAVAFLLMGFTQTLDAFRPSYEGYGAYVTSNNRSEGQVSYRDRSSHGDFQPRLFGRLAQTSLRYDDRTVHWLTHSHERGNVHMWGDPLFVWPKDASLSAMDRVMRQFIDQNETVFGITSKDLIYSKERSRIYGSHQTISYQRVFQNVPVEGAYITFRFNQRRLVQITNHSFGELDARRIESPQVSAREAAEAVFYDVMFEHGADELVGKIRPEVQPYYDRDGSIRFRYVYQIDVKKERPVGYWRYSVGASDGKLVRLINGLHYQAQVSGQLYPRHPSDSIKEVPLADVYVENAHQQKDLTDNDGFYDISPDRAVSQLKGKHVNVQKNHNQKVSQQADSYGDIHFSSEFLSENMAYYHVNRVNRYVQNFLRGSFLRKPLRVGTHVKHGVLKSCNAWYDPDETSLNFLSQDDQCHDSSHIADIIYHEWGHFLDDQLGGIQDRAFSEAISDVLSLLMTDDPELAPGFQKGTSKPMRSLDRLRVYPKDRHSNPHTEGLIVGGAWYEFYELMKEYYGPEEGRYRTTDIFLNHLVSADNYLDSYQATLVVDDDNGNLGDCTPHMCLLNQAFSRRGLTREDERCNSGDYSALPACSDSTIKSF